MPERHGLPGRLLPIERIIMAGHSKWANIQHRKGRQDAKRSNLWTKLVREIIVAARMGGGDPESNSRLRLALIKARGGKIIAVIARGDEQVRRSADFVIEVPVIAECLMPIVVSVPLQLLAYYIAVYKGRNVDQPRNLAKSVTVE